MSRQTLCRARVRISRDERLIERCKLSDEIRSVAAISHVVNRVLKGEGRDELMKSVLDLQLALQIVPPL
jgi:hypothetical protein